MPPNLCNKYSLLILLSVNYVTVENHFDAFTYLQEKTNAFISIEMQSFL